MSEGFDGLLRLAERLIENDFSENMWRTGYTDFDSHTVKVKNISKFADDALTILRKVLDDNYLPKTVVEGVERYQSNSGTVMKKLLCLLAALMRVSPQSCKNPTPVILSSACLYLRLAPLSKQLGVGFSLFQKHIYLLLLENLKTINASLASSHSSVPKSLLATLKCFPIFLNETGMDDNECFKATADLLSRIAYTDVDDLAQYGGNNPRSVGILTLKETDTASLGIGSMALYCIGEMVRRYAHSEDVAAAIIVSFFPLLLCVDEPKRGTQLPSNIPQNIARQSDILADFLGHLCFDLHVKIPLSNVIQQLVDRVPEKAEYRERVVKVAIRLARCVSSTDLDALVNWAVTYGTSSRAGSRVVAIELLHGLRSLSPGEGTLNMIIRHFVSRSSDSSSIVRNRALALLGDCLTSLSQSRSQMSLGSRPEPMSIDAIDADSNSRSSVDDGPTVPRIEVEIAVLTTAIRLADDSRAPVRRTALTLLETALPMIVPACSFSKGGNDVAVVYRRGFETCAQRCVDCSQLVRRQAACTTTEVLVKTLEMLPMSVASSDDVSWIGRIWLSSVMPLVNDNEQRIQEKVVELITVVAVPSVPASDKMPQSQQLCWSLLNSLAMKTRSFSGFYRSGLTLCIKSKLAGTLPKINGGLQAAADTIKGSNERFKAAAWFLVGEVTAALGAANESQRAVKVLERVSPGATWLAACRAQEATTQLALTTLECILGVLAAQVSYAPNTIKDVKDSLIEDLSGRLNRMMIPSSLIRAASCVLFLMSPKQAQKVLSGLVNTFLTSDDKIQPEKLRRCLAAMGCLGELSVGTTSSKATLGRIPEVTDVVFTKLTSLAQDNETDELVKAQCLFSIGQLCVADRSSALRLVPVVCSVLTEIASAASAAHHSVLVRMAALSVLTDWCMWHTSVAEPYVDQMAVCLRDPQPMMRKHALGVIGRLLDGNFIRWHDALFFRFVTTVIDDDPTIRTAATRYFENIVLPREKQFFSRKFIDAMLHFNGYVGARIGQTLSQSQSQTSSQTRSQERQLATMAVLLGVSGDSNRKRRFGIYRYMIDSMGSYEERLGLVRRLTDNILLAAVREEIDVKGQTAGEAVIRDVCLILGEPNMRFSKILSHSSAVADDVENDDIAAEDENVAEKRAEARRTILSQAVRHVVCKELLPAIIAVRAYMERTKPSLLGPVCDLLVATYTEYKTELSDALADDPELVRELEFHMRQSQQQQRERAQLAALTNRPRANDTNSESTRDVDGISKSVEHDNHTADDEENGNNDNQPSSDEDEEDDRQSRSSRRAPRSESENSGPIVAHSRKGKNNKQKPAVIEEEPEEEAAAEEEEEEEVIEPVEKRPAKQRGGKKKPRRAAAVAADDDDDE